MGSSNFKQFNPNAANMTNDTDYNSSSYRLNGVVPGQAPSALHNKLFYQVSTMAAAIGQVLADAGKTVTDSNLTSLIADLKDVFIQVPGFPKGYMGGPAPVYTSASTVTFKAGMRFRDSLNAADMELTADVPVSLASAGAGGLDAGSEAANTWYYFYQIRKSGDGTTSVVASTINEAAAGSITLPTGYDQKRQLPFAVRNDASSNIIPFCVGYGWPYRPYIWYNVRQSSNIDGTVGPCNVLNNGTASSWTTINLSNLVPPISTFAKLKTEITNGGSATVAIRKAGETHEGNAIAIPTGGQHGDNTDDWETNSSQQVQYISTGTPANLDINVIGYTVTGVV